MDSDWLLEIEDFEESLLTESLPNASNFLDKNGGPPLEPFALLNPDEVSYADFFAKYILANRPCLFTREITCTWNVLRDWTKRSDEASGDHRTINFDFLAQKYGHCTVSVTDCDKQGNDYDSPSCESMSLGDYVKYLQEFSQYPQNCPCLYLKDWHLVSASAELGEEPPYTVPKFFASDWLNETAQEQGDDYRFAYIGPKGSWTPFHADVYGSFSWSANLIGTKKWFLYPPGNGKRFENAGKLQFDVKNPGVKGQDYYEVVQGPGQVIFVPSGWHHIVWNLENTISINHNWINAANLGYIWGNLKSALTEVEAELDDLKNDPEFNDLCQGLLKANHGINFPSFKQILATVAKNRENGINYLPPFHLDTRHVTFDLMRINQVLQDLNGLL